MTERINGDKFVEKLTDNELLSLEDIYEDVVQGLMFHGDNVSIKACNMYRNRIRAEITKRFDPPKPIGGLEDLKDLFDKL